MYLPPHFNVEDKQALHEAMCAYPFATLVTNGADGPFATHLPLLLDPDDGVFGTLLGHVARANPHSRQPQGDEGPALVIFQGPQAYVSPAWYPSKREHGKVVPTWNYAIVQARGRLTIRDDPDWLLQQITAMTEMQEGPRPEPWNVSDAPAPFVAAQLKGIVGIEIEITRIEGKWKVSQNRPEADRLGVSAGLRLSQDDASHQMAELVDARGALPRE
jgi:transcriptional regulator